MTDREERFEAMLADVQAKYDSTAARMKVLQAEGKNKTVTYRELMGNKLLYQNLLNLYRAYGLIEKEP